jgi:hypothetical protein
VLKPQETARLITELGKDPIARATLLDATYDHSPALYENAHTNDQGSELFDVLHRCSRASSHLVGAPDHGATTEEGRRLQGGPR